MPNDRDTREIPKTERMPYVAMKPDAPHIENIEISDLLGRVEMSLLGQKHQAGVIHQEIRLGGST